MNHIDGFVAAVPDHRREDYLAFARKFAALFKEYGALRVVDCWGDDVPEGKLTSFPLAVKREPAETVIFGWVEWADKAARDAGWRRIEADPRMDPGASAMPFDGKRMIFGAFQTISDL